MNIQSGQGLITDLERIGTILGIKGGKNLCLLIQDSINDMKDDINTKDKRIKKLQFMNNVLQDKYSKLEFEKRREANKGNTNSVADTYKNENIKLRKNNEELIDAINGLKLELAKYKQEKINKIVYSNEVRDLEFKECLL